jgi:hypothetical protein
MPEGGQEQNWAVQVMTVIVRALERGEGLKYTEPHRAWKSEVGSI